MHNDNNMLAQTCLLVVSTDWSVKSPLCFQNRSALSVERLISLFDIKQKNIYDSAKDLRLHCYSSFKMSILKPADLEGIKPGLSLAYLTLGGYERAWVALSVENENNSIYIVFYFLVLMNRSYVSVFLSLRFIKSRECVCA